MSFTLTSHALAERLTQRGLAGQQRRGGSAYAQHRRGAQLGAQERLSSVERTSAFSQSSAAVRGGELPSTRNKVALTPSPLVTPATPYQTGGR